MRTACFLRAPLAQLNKHTLQSMYTKKICSSALLSSVLLGKHAILSGNLQASKDMNPLRMKKRLFGCFAGSGHVDPGLHAIFEPASVAIVGATDREKSVGRTLVQNLISGVTSRKTACKIYPVNPTRKEVLGLQCYPSIEAIPHDVEMVVIVTPAKTCLDLMEQCTRKNVKAAVVISAGFKEAGPEGVKLEHELVERARKGSIRIIGPNCVGVMNPNYGLNATFAATMGLPGSTAFISQSGAMCTAILDWSLREQIGFSAFISVGSMADVDWGDLLYYLGDEPKTESIIIYMEAIGDVKRFLAAAEKVALKKPITVIKAGKSDEAAKAAASHTGSLAGSYASFEATMNRAGVLTVGSIQEFADITLFLSKQPRPKGPKLLIITNAGGPAVLATDAAILSGAQIAKLSHSTIDKLNSFLPAAWSHSNPVDILGDAPAELYSKTLEVVMEEEDADGILVVLSPQDVTDPTGTAKALVNATKNMGEKAKKPTLAAWMGGDSVKKGLQILSTAGIPAFSQPDTAASVFGRLWQHCSAVNALYADTEFQSSPYIPQEHTKLKVLKILETIQNEGRFLLTEAESKNILELYDIKSAEAIPATTANEASAAASKIKSKLYAVKLNSKTLTHKADVGGVKLNLPASEVPKAFEEIRSAVTNMHGVEHFQGVTVQPMIDLNQSIELILGSSSDPQFGPVILFGSGGTMVEVYKDTALAIPPLNDNLAENLLKSTKIFKALKGGQGKRFEGVNIPELKQLMIRFSHMITDLVDIIDECDINPLLATADGQFIALDARILLRSKSSASFKNAKHAYPAN